MPWSPGTYSSAKENCHPKSPLPLYTQQHGSLYLVLLEQLVSQRQRW